MHFAWRRNRGGTRDALAPSLIAGDARSARGTTGDRGDHPHQQRAKSPPEPLTGPVPGLARPRLGLLRHPLQLILDLRRGALILRLDAVADLFGVRPRQPGVAD